MKKTIILMIALWAFVSIACCSSANGDCTPSVATAPLPDEENVIEATEPDNGTPEVLAPVTNDFPLEAIWIVAPGPLSQLTPEPAPSFKFLLKFIF